MTLSLSLNASPIQLLFDTFTFDDWIWLHVAAVSFSGFALVGLEKVLYRLLQRGKKRSRING